RIDCSGFLWGRHQTPAPRWLNVSIRSYLHNSRNRFLAPPMTDRQPGISEDEAVTLWRRAAEMHAASDRSGSSQAPVESDRHQMLSVHEVVEAAEGAGIHPDYVRL